MTCSFVWCPSKRVNEMKWKSINNWSRKSTETLKIRFIKADKLNMTAAARLAKYSNKSAPRGNSCVAALNFSFIGRWSKLGGMPSRHRRGNSLRIKITLERKPRRGFFVFRRGWFYSLRSARAEKEVGDEEASPATLPYLSLVSPLWRLSFFFRAVS